MRVKVTVNERVVNLQISRSEIKKKKGGQAKTRKEEETKNQYKRSTRGRVLGGEQLSVKKKVLEEICTLERRHKQSKTKQKREDEARRQ